MTEIICKYRIPFCPMLNDYVEACVNLDGSVCCSGQSDNGDICPRYDYIASDTPCKTLDYVYKEFSTTVKRYEYDEDPYGDGYIQVGKRVIDLAFIDYLKIGEEVKIDKEVNG